MELVKNNLIFIKTNLLSTRKWAIDAILITLLFIAAGCTQSQMQTDPLNNQTPSVPLSEQFDVVSKDGVEIACPKYWHPESDPSLIYCVSRSDYIRITVAALPALQQSYYGGLVKLKTVTETMVHGYPTYMNEYSYPYENHQLTTKCITMVQGGRACHIMILCDVSMLSAFEPTFEYVLNSVKFLAVNQ